MKLGLKPCTTNSARPGAAGRSGRAGAAHVYRDHPVARKSCFPGEWVRLGPPRAPPRPALPAIPASRPRDAARDAHVRGRPGRPGAARDGARGDQRGVQSTGNVLLRRTGVRPEPPRASPRPVPRPRAKAEACSRRAFCGPGTGAAWRGAEGGRVPALYCWKALQECVAAQTSVATCDECWSSRRVREGRRTLSSVSTYDQGDLLE